MAGNRGVQKPALRRLAKFGKHAMKVRGPAKLCHHVPISFAGNRAINDADPFART